MWLGQPHRTAQPQPRQSRLSPAAPGRRGTILSAAPRRPPPSSPRHNGAPAPLRRGLLRGRALRHRGDGGRLLLVTVTALALVSSWQRPSRSAASRSRRSEQQRGAGSQELTTQGQSSALACDGREARPEGGKVARAPPAPGGRRRPATERSGQGCVRAHRGDPPAPLGGRGCSARRRGWVSSPLLPREACPSLPCRGRGTAAGQRSVRGAACSAGSGRGKGASGER